MHVPGPVRWSQAGTCKLELCTQVLDSLCAAHTLAECHKGWGHTRGPYPAHRVLLQLKPCTRREADAGLGEDELSLILGAGLQPLQASGQGPSWWVWPQRHTRV